MQKTICYRLIEDVQVGGNSYFRAKWKWGIFWVSVKRYCGYEEVEGIWDNQKEALTAIDKHFKLKMANKKAYTVVTNITKVCK